MRFVEARDLLFLNDETLPGHPNAMRFTAFDDAGGVLETAIYFSIGGGFIVREGGSRHVRCCCAAGAESFFECGGTVGIGERRGVAGVADHSGK